jgi:uncharacterized protein YggE
MHRRFSLFLIATILATGALATSSAQNRAAPADVPKIAVGSGATSLGGIRFDLKDRAKLEREALRLAVANAREKADAAAAGGGRSIERIIRIDEQGTAPGPIPLARPMMKMEAAAAGGDAAPPIASGQMEIRALVTLTAVLK